jgi:hypothetical protein
MPEEHWYASPELLRKDTVFPDPVIDDSFWAFTVWEDGHALVEPHKSLPLSYIFNSEHVLDSVDRGADIGKQALGLLPSDFPVWAGNSRHIRPTVLDRTLTDGEAMFFVALGLASPERPVEQVLREIRACAALGLSTEIQEPLDEGFVFKQGALQAENYYNNPMRTIEQSPLVKELAQQVEEWAAAFAARKPRDVLKAHEWQILTAMGTVNGALLRGVLNEQLRESGKNGAVKATVHHPDYPLDDPSMHTFRFALFKGMHPRTDTPQYDVIDSSALRKLLPSDYKNLCVILTGTPQLAKAMDNYERRASSRYLW